MFSFTHILSERERARLFNMAGMTVVVSPSMFRPGHVKNDRLAVLMAVKL